MFQIDFASRVPIYEQIIESCIKLASVGALKPGDRLPPVRTLASQLGINPNTATKAYRDLESMGYIYTCVGRGSFLTEKLSADSALRLAAEAKFRKAAEEANKFGVSKDRMEQIIAEVIEGGVKIDSD